MSPARPAPRPERRPPARLNETEWKVMQALWRRQPLSAREVREELAPSTGWAYTTVKTLLVRLAEKGLVRETRSERAGLYAPLITQAEARRAALRALLDRAFEGGLAPMLGFLREERLTAKERATLEAMLAEQSTPRRAKPK
ncbi:MAG: BlaI/MecI/CopY family transcriptional regulator [Planctomycetota bacterium]